MKTAKAPKDPKKTPEKKPRRKSSLNGAETMKTIEKFGKIGKKEALEALEAISTMTSIASIKKRIAPKKPLIEKEPTWTSDQKREFKSKIEQCFSSKNSDFDMKNEVEKFLTSLRDYNLKALRMPEAIESHAEILELDNTINLAAYGLKPARGNWIICDLGSKQKNETIIEVIKEKGLEHNPRLVLPSLSPIGFVSNVGNILSTMISEGPERTKAASKRITNHAKLLCYACMAYIEIIDQQSQLPCPDIDQEGQNKTDLNKGSLRRQNTLMSWLKSELIKQCYAGKIEDDLEFITEEEIKSKISFNGSGNLSNHEAVAITCRISEELLIPLKQKRKRETLFKLRAILANKVFEEVKKHRKEELSGQDHILPEKPRYKTSCLWFVKHVKDSSPEILPIETSTNLYYWGNPNSEKDLHAIVPVINKKRVWHISKRELKTKLVENQSWLSWFAVGVLSLILAAGLKSEGSLSSNKITERAQQAPQTQQNGQIQEAQKAQVIKKQDIEP